MNEKNANGAAPQPLDNEELAEVAGGAVVDAGGGEEHQINTTSGAKCGTYNYITKVITYAPCPRCGKPMHTEWYNFKWYCDPCNYSEFLPTHKTWSGTQEELIAAAS